jgi:hypothetical protein
LSLRHRRPAFQPEGGSAKVPQRFACGLDQSCRTDPQRLAAGMQANAAHATFTTKLACHLRQKLLPRRSPEIARRARVR